jgi:nicotinic acid phosphoribosyltransferase
VSPVAVYLLQSAGHGAELRATVGHCSATQRAQHRAACAYIEQHPTLEVVGPIDETGTPFARTLHRAGSERRIAVRLDSGRYAVFVEVDHLGTVRANVRDEIDMSTGDHTIGTVTPAEPWAFTGVPGA